MRSNEPAPLLLRHAIMRAVFAVFAAILLLLSFVGGAAASAAVPCDTSGSELLSRLEPASDKLPGGAMDGKVHYHCGCGSHQMDSFPADLAIGPITGGGSSLALSRDLLPPGIGPASELRPPKA